MSINTNFCNNLNFFLVLNFNDPSNGLHWIYNVLHESEKRNEAVFIIGHTAPGKLDCFSKILQKYIEIYL